MSSELRRDIDTKSTLDDFDIKLKIVVLGESMVGKTSFITRYTNDKFGGRYLCTVGIDFQKKIIEKNGKKVLLQIWDTAGQFNVPSGKKEKVRCFDEENILALHKYFSEVKPTILNGDFAEAVKDAKAGDFVYFDPPYDVVGEQSFTSYTSNGFGPDEQTRLRDLIKELTEKGVYVMASNANTPFIQELYKDFTMHIVPAKRMINSNAAGRGEVEEVIITNY